MDSYNDNDKRGAYSVAEKTPEEKKEHSELMAIKADVFFKRSTPVHVSLYNKRFYNGAIIEMSSDFFLMVDKVLGDLPIFFAQIYDLVPLENKPHQDGVPNGRR